MKPERISLPDRATARLGREAFRFEEVTSTQDVLKRMARERCPEGTLVLAERQTAGRGRQGRSWLSVPGRQLLFSLFLTPKIPVSGLPLLNLAAGLALAGGMESAGVKEVRLRWPNDVLVRGRKISGILSEFLPLPRPAVVLGVGINMEGKEPDLPPEIRSTATTLEMEGVAPDRYDFLAAFLCPLEHFIEELEAGRAEPLRREFEKRMSGLGRMIHVRTAEGIRAGRIMGIDAEGALVLAESSGQERRILSGDLESPPPIDKTQPDP